MPSETTRKGEFACLKLEERAYEKGALVSKPTIECEYDRIVDFDGKLYRVQVKYAGELSKHCSGSVVANTVRTVGSAKKQCPISSESVDALVVYIPSQNMICWLPVSEWRGKKRIQLRVCDSKNNQKNGCRMAKDFLW